ncbi:GNAT family N-acetyltransferase [Umezawaea beigongshangensis]|uniref:GNAT family N-acetyltransferase n=1 Tax=Umezawaea beigongshangensis TaxID=2780383 RepID=UPI0018F19F2D|nr:GNAT family N-acetyltransferase [Umezawaea beigongshangensis]
MNEAEELEHRCADAWPALADEPLGEWRMRAAGGFTGRANSTLTTGDPGIPVERALRRAVDFAAANGIPPTAHVVVGSAAEGAVASAGWRVNLDHPGGAESVVLTGPVAAFPDSASQQVRIEALPRPTWWKLTASADPTPAQRHVLASGPLVGFGVGAVDGEVVAAVRGAVVGDLLHVARLAVRPEHRRRGLATELVSALAAWGAEHGATTVALQVAVHNTAAVRLYDALGCAAHHRYRYWVPA